MTIGEVMDKIREIEFLEIELHWREQSTLPDDEAGQQKIKELRTLIGIYRGKSTCLD